MKCWNCGAQNPKTAQVCKKCGSDLTQPKAEEVKAEEASTGQKVHPVIWIVIGVAAIALIITILFIAFSVSSPKEQGAAVVEPTSTVAATTTAEGSGTESSSTGSVAAATSTLKSKGEGCDYDTCAWMSQDQCVNCGNTWQTHGDESYCDCSESKWQSQELEWCQYEGGTWLKDENRCTFKSASASTPATNSLTSACSNLYYNIKNGDDAGYQAYRAACKNAGGVDECWDENCDLSVCLCPNENNLPVSCDWVSGEQITSTLKCYDENGTCWVTVEPTSAFSNLDQGIGKPQVVVATSEGKTYTSVDLENNNNGCIFDSDRISCLLSSGGTFNANTVSDIYMCMDMCCVNLGKMAAGDVVVQSGNCPGSGNLEVRDFKLNEGVLSIQLRNSLGWDADSLEVFLDDAKGDHWSTLSCKIDSKYNNIMNCQGWAVYKSGFATLSFYYGSGSDACSVTGVRFQIPEMTPCNYNQHYCSASGTCCSSGKTCCSCGCKKLDSGETCSDVCD